MEPKKARIFVRAAGAVVILVSVFLTWMSGLPVVGDASLAAMMGQALSGLQVTSLHFIIYSGILVILGALASFRFSLGGIPVLAGVGLFYAEWSRQLVLLACNPDQWPGCGPGGLPDYSGVVFGIGLYVAIAGAVVIFAAAIPQVLSWAKKRKKLFGAVLAITLVASASGLGFYFAVILPPADPVDTIPPDAVFQYWWIDGRTWQFDGRGSSDSGPNSSRGGPRITLYEWQFGDDTKGEGAEVTHSYVADGTYTVTLTVWDRARNSNSTSRTVEVFTSEAPPGAGFTVSITQVAVGTGNPINAWKIRFDSVPVMLATDISVVIFDANGATLLPETPIMSLHSSVGRYYPVDSTSPYIAVGDYILIGFSFGVGRAQVLPGSTFSLVDSVSFAELVSGTLQ